MKQKLMKNQLRKEISDLLNGSKKKGADLIAHVKIDGIYEVNGQILNEAEFQNLSENYKNVIIFRLHPSLQEKHSRRIV
jgi:hypothetical protein